MLRGLMGYAVRIGMRSDDPTYGFKIKLRHSGDSRLGVRTRSKPSASVVHSARAHVSRSNCY